MRNKLIIKVSSIFSLTDVRFFASQDVDFIGLTFTPGKEGQVTPALAKELQGWIRGPKIVAECTGMDMQAIEAIISEVQPEAIEAEMAMTGQQIHFQRINIDAETLPLSLPEADFLVVEVKASELQEDTVLNFLADAISQRKVILAGLTGEDLVNTAKALTPAGVEIMGSPEIATGLKDFSEIYNLLVNLHSIHP